MLPEIASHANPRIKHAIRLRESRTRRKERLFLIDGAREIDRALRSGIKIEEVYRNRDAGNTQDVNESYIPLLKRLDQEKITIWQVAPELFQKIAFGDRNENLVALASEPVRSWETFEEALPQNPLIGIIEKIEKPGNIGAVFRSADGAGLDGVILADCITDFYHPNAIRSSLGTLFSLPSLSVPSAEILPWLKKRNIQPVAAICQAARPYTEIDYRLPTAIILGSESDGLTNLWRTEQTQGVILPMLGIADSLNISNAAAILFYEARRQRGMEK